MSRGDPYGSRGPTRWDADRFIREREQFEEYRSPRAAVGGYAPRPRERSVDEVYERRVSGGRSYEDDRIRERVYYGEPEEPRYPARRRESVTIEREKEREYYSPSPPRRAPVPRPGLLRRQSSLDTFDRKPFRFSEREEYGPPAIRQDYRREFAPAPLPRYRALPPPRRYAERDFEEIKISEPEFYGDDDYRPYPERVREREIIRTRRRSRSRESRVRSNSSSSSSSSEVVIHKQFPKRGKTRMPGRLVSIKAIIDLGYPYEQDGDVVVIQKALGPDNIDEVIKLSETYKRTEKTTEMSGGRSEAGNVVEERREEIVRQGGETIEKTTFERREISPARSTISRSRSVGPSPRIVDARPVEVVERSANIPLGPLVLLDSNRAKDERAIRAEIAALEAERQALRAEQKATREMRKAEMIRREGREGNGDLIVYEREVIKERDRSPDGGVIIKKDKKGRMSLSVPSSKR